MYRKHQPPKSKSTAVKAESNTIPPMLESEFQDQVVDLARRLGYDFIYHTWNSQNSPAGFPDLMILRGHLIVMELKSESGTLTPEQYFWLLAFLEITPFVYVFKPSDWDEVVEALQKGRGSL